ncbi:MAG TPA: ATP-grasp domain-containing protein, partial [bacterium]
MGTKRRAYIEEIARRIGRRKLVWFGHNGSNARPLTSLPQFSRAFSVMSPAGLGDHREVCIEHLTGERVRTGGHELHPETSEVDRQFHQQVFDSLGEPTVTVTHQASRFFASVYFLRREFVQHLGLFHERQVVFDHKPWVETELREIGIRVVPWRYLATHDANLRPALERALQGGPLVLRANRSISGRGLTMVRHPDEIAQVGEGTNPDGFIAVAPFLEPSVPLNVNACVFPDGTVSLHSPSLQLIGIPGAGSPFTYCGNDFAQVRELDEAILDTLQEMATRVGRWLCSMGYAGAFGVDALLYQGAVYLTEVNPRFQGSSLVSASLDAELDRPDMYLTH